VDTELLGRGAVVGGGSRGLGRAAAEALAAEGCRLLLWSRDRASLEHARAEIAHRHGVEVHVAAADARDPGAADSVAAAAEKALGAVDICVLNSGGPPIARAGTFDRAGWLEALQLLTLTPVDLAARLLPSMRARGWGRLVAILSSGVRQPIDGLVYSNAGRGALAAWMKTLAAEIAGDGVTVNGILPGRLDTDRTRGLDAQRAQTRGISVEEIARQSQAEIPSGRYGRPAELGSLVAYLCSDVASYQTGTLTAVDGGLLRGV